MEACIIFLRNLDTRKIGAEVFGELQNVLLEKHGDVYMVVLIGYAYPFISYK